MSRLDSLLEEMDKCAVVDSYAASLNKVAPPKVIYHYTNGDGLRGVLESGRLWFTDIFYLNDVSEIRHGVAYACELLRTEALSTASTNIRKKFAETVARKLTENIEDSAHFFVCCFSKNGDDLGQWRAYADNGRGFAVGFRADALERNYALEDRTKNSTFPVSYDGDLLRKMQSKVIAEALRILDAAGLEVTAHFLSKLSVRLSAEIIHCSIYFKHAGYKNEEEYRFMQVHPGMRPVANLKIRTKPYSLVRFTEFDWKAKCLETLCEVVIGPASDLFQAQRFVADCKRLYLPENVSIEVRRSGIPYRSV